MKLTTRKRGHYEILGIFKRARPCNGLGRPSSARCKKYPRNARCGWVYIEIGVKFTAGREIDDNHPYKAWLMTYSVPEFKTMVDWWFDILDEAVQGYPQKELDHIKEIFIKSCLYEWMFWDMAWHKKTWKIQHPQ